MKILIDNEEQKRTLLKLQGLQKYIELKKWGNKKIHRCRRIEYIKFSGKKVEEIIIKNLFNTLENRYRLALYCLEKIRKECEIVDYNESKKEGLINKIKKESIKPEFVITCEYFIFAINSGLDTMSYIINLGYNFEIRNHRVSFSKIYEKMKPKRDKFSRYILKEWKIWINEFREIRNKMTHHQIIGFSSNLNHEIQNKKITFTKHCISIINRKDENITKPLPTYFDKIIKNYENLKHEFYKKINSII